MTQALVTQALVPDDGNCRNEAQRDIVREGVVRAFATIERGCAFLASGLRMPGCPDAGPGLLTGKPGSARVLGNGLRELDRFLNVLIDEVARLQGLDVSGSRRKIAMRLSSIGADKVSRFDGERLSALRRSRDCLFFANGIVRRGDRPGLPAFSAGWLDEGKATLLRRFHVGETLTVSAVDLEDICRFYRQIAKKLVGDTLSPSPDRRVDPKNISLSEIIITTST